MDITAVTGALPTTVVALPRLSRLILAGLSVVAATAFSFSPAGTAAVLGLAVLWWYTVRDLGGGERRWVGWCLGLAMALRVCAVAALPLLRDPSRQSFVALFGDTEYAVERSIWISKALVGAPFGPRDYFEAFDQSYGWSGYNYVLAWMHTLFGPSPYAAHLLSAVLYFCAIAILFRYARRGYGAAAAFVGLAAASYLPSLFVWSISPLKESIVYVLIAVGIGGAIECARPGRWWKTAAGLSGIAAALVSIYYMRPFAAVLLAVSLAIAAALIAISYRRRLGVILLLAGIIAAAAATQQPRVRALATGAVQLAAEQHFGHVFTAGHSFRLLDDRYYTVTQAKPDALTPRDQALFLARGVVRFFTVPEPWILRGPLEVALLPQQIVWYALVGFGLFGIAAGFRLDRVLTSVLSGVVIAGAILIGPTGGNIGTLIRHRDMIVPFGVWLSAAGIVHAVETGRFRRFHTIDALAVAVPVVLVGLFLALFFAFREPLPRLLKVDPAIVYTPGRVTLHGELLRPFLRAFVAPAGQPIELRDRHDVPPQAQYWIRTPGEAELQLPALRPAAYDLALFEGAEEIARLSKAFTVERMVDASAAASVTLSGRFVQADGDAGTHLISGATIVSDGRTVVKIVEVGPAQPHIEPIGPGTLKTWVRLSGRIDRPATLRLECQLQASRCRFAGQPVVPGESLTLSFEGADALFIVDAAWPDAGDPVLTGGPAADAIVEFVTRPEVPALIRPGDTDLPLPGFRTAIAARIVRILSVTPTSAETVIDGQTADQRFVLQEPLVRIRALLRMAVRPDGVLNHRNDGRVVGQRIMFDTPRYSMTGTVVSIAASIDVSIERPRLDEPARRPDRRP